MDTFQVSFWTCFKLLWEGIAVYIKNYNVKVLIGCASFHRKDPDIFKAVFSLLYQMFVLPENYSVRSLQNSTNILICNINYQKAFKQLPPLIKGYLRVSGMVSKDYFIHKKFETIDFCVVVLTDKKVNRYYSKFLH